MNQLNMNTQTFPMDEWVAAMETDVSDIDELGHELVARHRLGGKGAEECTTRSSLFAAAREILESLVGVESRLEALQAQLLGVDGHIVLKDVVEGKSHDDVIKVINSRKGRYE